jgi:MFS family permease
LRVEGNVTLTGNGVALAERVAKVGLGDQSVPPHYKWQVLVVAGAGIFMSTLSNGMVNVALPVLTREFDARLMLAQWVVLGYELCITGLCLITSPATMMEMAPVGGWFSDRPRPRVITPVGLSLEVAVLASVATARVDTHSLAVSGLLVLVGVALALVSSPNSNGMFSSVRSSHLGLVGGLQALSWNLGQPLGQTVAFVALTLVMVSLPPTVRVAPVPA